jgi:hypothetical protein
MAGDGDPFPLAKAGKDPFPLPPKGSVFAFTSADGRWVKGVGKFSAFQIETLVTVVATGMTRFNYQVKLVASPLTVFPPQYGLFFLVPDIVLPAERPFAVDAHFFAQGVVPNVICWDADGSHDVKVVQLKK